MVIDPPLLPAESWQTWFPSGAAGTVRGAAGQKYLRRTGTTSPVAAFYPRWDWEGRT
jgi:hypothetical protein